MWQENGTLVIGDTTFKGVKPENLKLLSDLSSGDYGEVTMRKYQGRSMAVKVNERGYVKSPVSVSVCFRN